MTDAGSDNRTEIAADRERCPFCGFDSDLYNRADTTSSQHIIPAVLRAAAEGLDPDVLAARPDDSTWSIAEYTDHVRETAFGNRLAIEVAVQSPGTDLGEAPEPSWQDDPADIDHEAALQATAEEFSSLRELLAGLSDDGWRATVILDGKPVPVDWFARHVLHDGLHHLADIGRIRGRLGHGAATGSGTVTGLFRSEGGVPKSSIETAAIGPEGMDGDRQADRKHHGRPVQAICLWSGDVIAALQADGHPIAPGAAGENVTVSGVTWAELRPGVRIDIGAVPMLISAHAIPCAKNAQWFSDRDFKRILHERNPGLSRLYAIPLGRGSVSVGDPVVVEPRS